MGITDRLLDAFEVECPPRARAQLELYFDHLQQWNRTVNLTGLKGREEMVRKHLSDSLLLFRHLPSGAGTLMDIGTGPGVPGLLIKILRPDLDVTLVEAVKKKCSFLRFVIARLGLDRVFVEQIRISPGHPPRSLPPEGFNVIVSQAAGSLCWLWQTGGPFLAEDGVVIALKGPRVEEELEELMSAHDGSGRLRPRIETLRLRLPETGWTRSLVFMQPQALRADAAGAGGA
jgi:16S rRNA (guanine527-N7)-methyltransferase